MQPVVITAYDPEWPRLFERIAEPVRAALDGVATVVEHVGSTAVPGLPAKPVIDIDVVVRRIDDVPAAIARLASLGYEHQGDKGVPGREAFKWPPDTFRHHLYVVVEGSQAHSDHVRFRDYLREHPQVAADYANLKRGLAERHANDRDRYTEAKADFIARVLSGVEPHSPLEASS